MDRLKIVVEFGEVLTERVKWRAREHELRWVEHANEGDYRQYRADKRRELFKTDWLPMVADMSAATMRHMPTGLLADLYPQVLAYGPQADAWDAWNRHLVAAFENMNALPGHQRQKFVNDFIAMYGSRIRIIDPGAETAVFDSYRDTYETTVAWARINLQQTRFVSRTLPNMKPGTWDMFLYAYECAAQLILLADVLTGSDPRWEKSLRAHRAFTRKTRAMLR